MSDRISDNLPGRRHRPGVLSADCYPDDPHGESAVKRRVSIERRKDSTEAFTLELADPESTDCERPFAEMDFQNGIDGLFPASTSSVVLPSATILEVGNVTTTYP
jgi:hypothetical protein